MTSVLTFTEQFLTKDEIKDSDREADLIIVAHHALEESLKNEIERLMKEEGLRFSDIRKKLDITDKMAAKLIKGGSVNFDTISKISKLNGKIPKIIWEDKPKSAV